MPKLCVLDGDGRCICLTHLKHVNLDVFYFQRTGCPILR